MTGTTSAFGLELDSLADVISFGLAPAVLAFVVGAVGPRARWAGRPASSIVTAAAMRLARFNIQSPTQIDKRYFVGMPSPAAAGVVAATVFVWPSPLTRLRLQAVAAWRVVLVPAALMVSTIRFRSFKTHQLRLGAGYVGPLLFAVLLTAHRRSSRSTRCWSWPTAICSRRSSGWLVTRLRARRDAARRQPDRRPSCPARRARDRDRAAAQLDVALGVGQAQTGSGRLGREVRLERALTARRRPCRRRCRRAITATVVASARADTVKRAAVAASPATRSRPGWSARAR